MEQSSHSDHDPSSSDDDTYSAAEQYYQALSKCNFNRVRTFSVFENQSKHKQTFIDDTQNNQVKSGAETLPLVPIYEDSENIKDPSFSLRRRSHDASGFNKLKKFLISDIDLTLEQLLKNEDTNHDYQITIEDTGPKVLKLGTLNSNGYNQYDIRGTYMLSNLLQELAIAKRAGKSQLVLDEERLSENPVSRIKRLITTEFWSKLTRQVTNDNIIAMSKDTKIPETFVDENGKTIEIHRIYVPYNRTEQYEYFKSIKVSDPNVYLDIQYLPETIDAHYIRSINKKPGLLALQSYASPQAPDHLVFEPYVVPGGRFNEFYGWDSYMETLGLLVDATPQHPHHLYLTKSMAENFIYEINNYGKILNANRSYYLGRSQPPFLTDMVLRIFNKYVEVHPEELDKAIDFLRRAVRAAIKEYRSVWTAEPRFDKRTQLSCYHPEGVGIPPETEASHFIEVLKPYCVKYNVCHEEFIDMYNSDQIDEPALDEYFLHDRAIRESGHDTSYRLEGKCAHLATVDLNSLLYKYEIDIAFIIESFFNNSLELDDGTVVTKDPWIKLADQRRINITKYLWNERDSMFYDYNIKTQQQTGYESATTFWPLWSKVATDDQANKLVTNSLSKLEEYGGLVAGTKTSRGHINLSRPSRQWDYPNGWAPQQMLAWVGLANYGFDGVCRRLVYKWLYLITKTFADYNGVVVEKYNVVEGQSAHRVDAEYGNQGADFKYVPTEGFGWVNASYLFGLTFLNLHATRNLGTLTPPKAFFENMNPSQRALYQ